MGRAARVLDTAVVNADLKGPVMELAFMVLRSRGPAWDESKPLEAQTDWTAHAMFMDALYENGFAALVGPLEGTRDALIIMRAASAEEIAGRLAADPWSKSGLLVTKQVSPWRLRLGTLAADASRKA